MVTKDQKKDTVLYFRTVVFPQLQYFPVLDRPLTDGNFQSQHLGTFSILLPRSPLSALRKFSVGYEVFPERKFTMFKVGSGYLVF
jgi:hypothetical protein